MKGISNATNATLMAQAAAVAGPYNALAAALGAHAQAEAQAVTKATDEKVSTWTLMKSAISIARDNGHSHEVMRAGLEIACVQANVPSGSFRGYMSTIENLAADLESAKLTLAQVNDISVKDARKRYAAPPSAEQAARARLAAAIKDWTAAHINTLAQLAEDDNAKNAPAETTEEAQPEAQRKAA